MTFVMVFALLGKVVAALKEVAVAWRFGISDTVDAYLFIFNIVLLPTGIWFSSLSVLVIPLLGRLSAAEERGSGSFERELFGWTIVAGVATGLVTWIVLVILVESGTSGLSPAATGLARSMASWLSLITPIGFVIYFGSVIIMASGRHSNTLYEGLPAACILLAVLIVGDTGPVALLIGTLVGGFVHLIAVGIDLYRSGRLPRPRLGLSSPAWSGVWTGVGIIVMAQAIQAITGAVDQFAAARLGSGAIATLAYSERIMSLVLTLSSTVIGRALLPILSAGSSSADNDHRRIVRSWANALFIGGVVVLIIGWTLAPYIVTILFERGAFSHKDTVAVAEIFRLSLIRLPVYLYSLTLVQYIISRRNYHHILWISIINIVAKIIFIYIAMNFFGLKGVVLSTAAMYAMSSLYTSYFAFKVRHCEIPSDGTGTKRDRLTRSPN
ncbi:MAG: hypothetical protein E6R12_03500 [Sphingomonadales bacterium]|nr:MAG: hypothetical protein E6R12_03500 [Sphingomonadales bacterium]